jgi:omega-amidase
MQDLKVTLVQSALAWEDIDANLASFGKKLYGIAPASTDIIVLPEMFSTGFTMNVQSVAETMDGKAIQWLAKQAEEKKCVVTGSLVIKDGNHFYNRLIWMKADGTFEYYDKRHLFRMGQENNTYSPGNKRLIPTLKGWKICPLICYDLRFPVWSRNKANSFEYDCLIYVANWPEKRSYAWKNLLIARAIENQAYVIGVNRTGADGNQIMYSGNTAAINANGEIISKTKPEEESVETVILSRHELEELRKNFPVGLDADEFNFII